MDERRHNMDGALFVDDDERAGEPRRGARAADPRGSKGAAEPRRTERTAESRGVRGAAEPHGIKDAAEPRDTESEGEFRDLDPDDDERPLAADDEKADDARRVTQSIIDRMDLDARVTIREDDERVVLDIDGPDAGRAIGKKGMTLEALQFLVNKIVNRDPEERRHIVLDSGDYRERHDSGLVAMAKREAKRAVSSGRAVTLEPMSARDRRVIHVSLAKFPGVSTRSEGEGSDRRLQIIPARGGAGTRERDDRPRERPRGPGREGRGRGPGGGRPASPAQGQAVERLPRTREAEPETQPHARERDLDLDFREREGGEGGYDDRDRAYDDRED